MDFDIKSGDDYLEHVGAAIAEASAKLDLAATVSVESGQARQQLGETLGQARNALTRAQRDLRAHVERESRRDDRCAAEGYMKSLLTSEESQPHIVVAIIPLPLEEQRIPIEQLASPDFANDFTNWVTRFNYDEGRKSLKPYLFEMLGGMTPRVDLDRFRFDAIPDGGTEPSQSALLYGTGAFVFTSRLYSWEAPPSFTLALPLNEVKSTIEFVWWLYEELSIVPRSVALQVSINGVSTFHGSTAAKSTRSLIDWTLNEQIDTIIAPERAVVHRFGVKDEFNKAAQAVIEAAIKSNCRQSPAS